ncbi:MAG: TadG family pilus assembly protein, partial [Myxococcota bacterium]
AAARAGAARLDGTEDGMVAARDAALVLAAANPAGGVSIALDPNTGNDPDGDVVLGVWDDDADAFVPSDDPLLVDTVQVRARLPEVRLFFAQVAMGKSTTPVSARTRAVAPASPATATECYIPLALPSCLVYREGTEGLQDLDLQLNNPGTDDVGWARVNGSPNANWSRDQMLDCQQGGEAAIGDPVTLQNGAVVSALGAVADRISTSDTSWDPEKWGTLPPRMTGSSITPGNYGKTFEGPMPVFESPPEYCIGSGGSFTGSYPLVGFVWASLYDVRNAGPVSDRTVKVRVDTTRTYDFGSAWDGAPDWGALTYAPPRMVQSH